MLTTGNPDLDRGILSFGFTLLAAYIARRLRPRSNLKWYVSHIFTFSIRRNDGQPLLIEVGTLVLVNSGTEIAKNVEVHHAVRPENFQIWPTLQYSEANNPEGFHIIKIDSLAPKEHVTIEMMATNKLPLLSRVRSEMGEASRANFRPMPVLPNWFNVTIVAFMGIGVATTIYLVIKYIQGLL